MSDFFLDPWFTKYYENWAIASSMILVTNRKQTSKPDGKHDLSKDKKKKNDLKD